MFRIVIVVLVYHGDKPVDIRFITMLMFQSLATVMSKMKPDYSLVPFLVEICNDVIKSARMILFFV
jgi:hypothetical protein